MHPVSILRLNYLLRILYFMDKITTNLPQGIVIFGMGLIAHWLYDGDAILMIAMTAAFSILFFSVFNFDKAAKHINKVIRK